MGQARRALQGQQPQSDPSQFWSSCSLRGWLTGFKGQEPRSPGNIWAEVTAAAAHLVPAIASFGTSLHPSPPRGCRRKFSRMDLPSNGAKPLGADNTTDSSVMSDPRSQISVSVGQNISTSHLATAIASSERQCTPSRGDGVLGVPKTSIPWFL